MRDNGPSIRELIARLAELDESVAATPACLVDACGVPQVNPLLRELAQEELQIVRTLALRRQELRGWGPCVLAGGQVPSAGTVSGGASGAATHLYGAQRRVM